MEGLRWFAWFYLVVLARESIERVVHVGICLSLPSDEMK